MISPQDRERLHDYLDGRLSPAQRAQFERDLESRSALRSEHASLDALRAGLAELREDRAPAEFRDAVLKSLRHDRESVGEARRPSPRSYWLPSAMAAALVIGVTVLFSASWSSREVSHLGSNTAQVEPSATWSDRGTASKTGELGGLVEAPSVTAPQIPATAPEQSDRTESRAVKTAGSSEADASALEEGNAEPRAESPREGSHSVDSLKKAKSSEADQDSKRKVGGTRGVPIPPGEMAKARPVGKDAKSRESLEESKARDRAVGETMAPEAPDSTGETLRVLRITLPKGSAGRADLDAMIRSADEDATLWQTGYASGADESVTKADAEKGKERFSMPTLGGRSAGRFESLVDVVRAHEAQNPGELIEHVADDSWLASFVTRSSALGCEVAEAEWIEQPSAQPGPGANQPATSIGGGGPAGGGGGPAASSGPRSSSGASSPSTPASESGSPGFRGTPGSARDSKKDAVKTKALDEGKKLAATSPLLDLDPGDWRWNVLSKPGAPVKMVSGLNASGEPGRQTATGRGAAKARTRFVIVVVQSGD